MILCPLTLSFSYLLPISSTFSLFDARGKRDSSGSASVQFFKAASLFQLRFSNLMLILLQVSMVTQVENDGSELRRNVFSPLE